MADAQDDLNQPAQTPADTTVSITPQEPPRPAPAALTVAQGQPPASEGTNPPGWAKVAQARLAGASWDDISSAFQQKRAEAKAAGATDADVDAAFTSFFGYKDPTPVLDELKKDNTALVQASMPAAATFKDALKAGWQWGGLGLMTEGKPTEGPPQGFIDRQAFNIAQFVSDLPIGIGGAILGEGAGIIGGAGAGAAVPGGGETGVTEAIGSILGASAGAKFGFGYLPQMVRSYYMDGLANGHFQNPQDFGERMLNMQEEGLKAGLVSWLTMRLGGAGSDMVEGTLKKAMAGASAGSLANFAGGWMTSGNMPTSQDLVDSGVMTLELMGVSHTMEFPGETFDRMRRNFARYSGVTGQMPQTIAQAAAEDPIALEKVLLPQNPKARPGSSMTPTPDDGHLVINRAAGSFDKIVGTIIDKFEGGMTSDTGGLTKYGISQKSYPQLDIANLSRDDAINLYKHDYWDKLGLDTADLDPKMKMDVMDAAVNEGVAKAQEMLELSKGNFDEFHRLRGEHYLNLAARDPEKYGQYLDSWMGRLRAIRNYDGSDLSVVREGKNDLPEYAGSDTGGKVEFPTITKGFGLFKEASEGGEGGGLGGGPVEPPGPDDISNHWQIVGSRIAPPPATPSWMDQIKGAAFNAYREIVDRQAPVNRLFDAIDKGKDISDANNPRFLQRLTETSSARAKYMIEENMINMDRKETGPGLNKIIAPFKSEGSSYADDNKPTFWRYMTAKWATENAKKNKETGVDLTAAEKVLQEGAGKYDEASNQVSAWRNGLLDYYHEGGLASAKDVAKWKDENKFTMPGYRFDPTINRESPGYGKTAFKSIKQMFGSDKKVLNPYVSLMKDAFVRTHLAEGNAYRLKLIDALQGLEGSDGEPIAQKVKEPAIRFELHANEIDELAKLMDGDPSEDLEAAIYRHVARKANSNEIPVIRDGKIEKWTLHPEFADATRVLRNEDTGPLTPIQRMVAPFTNFTRQMTVLNPLFGPKVGAWWDVPWQWMSKPGSRNTLMDFAVGLHAQLTGGQELNRAKMEGLVSSIMERMNDKNYIQDQRKAFEQTPGLTHGIWNAVTSPIRALQAWGDLTQSSLRTGQFIRRIRAGENTKRASAVATEAAFHRPGFGGSSSRRFNAAYQPFLTAYINNLLQSAKGQLGGLIPNNKTIGGEQHSAVGFTMKAIALTTMPMLLNWYMAKDEEWYKAAPEWQKDTGLIVPGLGSGHMYLPLNPGPIGFLYGTLPRRIMEAAYGERPWSWEDMATSGFANFFGRFPLLAWSVMQPLIEQMSNHNFTTGGKIVSDSQAAMLPPVQSTPYTSDTAKLLATGLNNIPRMFGGRGAVSSIVVDRYLRDWGGELGYGFIRATETALQRAGISAQDLPERSWTDIPGIAAWQVRYPSASTQPVVDFENMMDQVKQVHATLMHQIKTDDLDGFKQTMTDNSSVAMLHALQLSEQDRILAPKNPEQFQSVISKYAPKQGTQEYEDLTNILRAENWMKEHHLREEAIAAPQMKFSPEERQQLLETSWAQDQHIAEWINKTLFKLGVKP